jgi:hypothetical protein
MGEDYKQNLEWVYDSFHKVLMLSNLVRPYYKKFMNRNHEELEKSETWQIHNGHYWLGPLAAFC